MTDLHRYDGALLITKSFINEEIAITVTYSREQRDQLLLEATDYLLDSINTLQDQDISNNRGAIMHILSLIVGDHKIHGRVRESPNYDPSNDLFACDLLILCYWRLSKDKSLLKIFFEQLVDMMTGVCPPGRTTRLFQFLSAG